MKGTNALRNVCLATLAAVFVHQSQALTVPFMEDFVSNNSNWLNGASASATWLSSGGVDGGSYISYTAPAFTSNSSGSFGAPPFQLMLRTSNSSSGGAFAGDWLSGGVSSLGISVRHNYESTLNFYARLAAGTFGAGASLASDSTFALTPNTWTFVSIPIVQSNPPFSSYGSGTFNGTFSNIQNFQFGLYLPASTEFTGLQMDIDSVSIVPEPTTVGLVIIGLVGLGLLRGRQSARSQKQ